MSKDTKEPTQDEILDLAMEVARRHTAASEHELVFVYKHGEAPHLNTFGLGAGGRTRSNVWRYAGANTFRAGRMDELTMESGRVGRTRTGSAWSASAIPRPISACFAMKPNDASPSCRPRKA